jgi:hypothetical protein
MSSVNPIEQFFVELDGLWGGAEPRLALKVLGSTALMLQADYLRGTKDSDVLGVMPVEGEIKDKLRTLAGPGSRLEALHHFYLDVVPSGLPFLPHPPQFSPLDSLDSLDARLGSFQVSVLSVVDVVVSKLKRFNGHDRDDVRAMVDMELVEHEPLLERFRSAVDRFSMDARADDLPAIIKHLHWVERECFFTRPTRIELPPWVDPD